MVIYHWLARRYPAPLGFLMRPQLNGDTLAGLMKQLWASESLEVFAHQVLEATAVPVAFPRRPFVCLLWNHGTSLATESSAALLLSLIRSGCRYFVCGGTGCETWHDLVDEVFVEEYLDSSDEERDRAHVMTTWHTDQSPDDVAFFFAFNTRFDDVEFERYLVLHLRPSTTKDVVDDAVVSQFESRIGKP